MDRGTGKKLVVVADTKGNVIATAFPQDQQIAGGMPNARMLPANKKHHVFEIDVPANFQELSPDRLHESVKERVRSTAAVGRTASKTKGGKRTTK
jgi:hypothetical protein